MVGAGCFDRNDPLGPGSRGTRKYDKMEGWKKTRGRTVRCVDEEFFCGGSGGRVGFGATPLCAFGGVWSVLRKSGGSRACQDIRSVSLAVSSQFEAARVGEFRVKVTHAWGASEVATWQVGVGMVLGSRSGRSN